MAGNTSRGRIGLNCALSTPFMKDGTVDLKRLVAHAGSVLARGCDGITAFGTTGEGASLAVSERYQVLAALAAAGIDPRTRVIAGVSAASVADAVAQARAGYEMNCRGLLVFEQLGGELRDVILYHIPGMTRNGISIALTQRLMQAFPGVIIGVKDSNGDWDATERRLVELKGLQVLVGDERQLAKAVRHGGAGTICGLANIAPDLLRPLAHDGQDDPRVGAMVEAILGYSFMAAIKAMIGHAADDPAWRIMRPPLDALSAGNTRKLAAKLAAIRAPDTAAAPVTKALKRP
jgi:4-hydroxy-tetrahydrodipicolinate synthase